MKDDHMDGRSRMTWNGKGQTRTRAKKVAVFRLTVELRSPRRGREVREGKGTPLTCKESVWSR